MHKNCKAQPSPQNNRGQAPSDPSKGRLALGARQQFFQKTHQNSLKEKAGDLQPLKLPRNWRSLIKSEVILPPSTSSEGGEKTCHNFWLYSCKLSVVIMLLTTCTNFYIGASYSRKKSGQSKAQVWEKCREPHAQTIPGTSTKGRPPSGLRVQLGTPTSQIDPLQSCRKKSHFTFCHQSKLMDSSWMDGCKWATRDICSFTPKVWIFKVPKMYLKQLWSWRNPLHWKGGAGWTPSTRHHPHTEVIKLNSTCLWTPRPFWNLWNFVDRFLPFKKKVSRASRKKFVSRCPRRWQSSWRSAGKMEIRKTRENDPKRHPFQLKTTYIYTYMCLWRKRENETITVGPFRLQLPQKSLSLDSDASVV